MLELAACPIATISLSPVTFAFWLSCLFELCVFDELLLAMRKLAFVFVVAVAKLRECFAQLGLVLRVVYLRRDSGYFYILLRTPTRCRGCFYRNMVAIDQSARFHEKCYSFILNWLIYQRYWTPSNHIYKNKIDLLAHIEDSDKNIRKSIKSFIFGSVKPKRIPILFNPGTFITVLEVDITDPFELPFMVPEVLSLIFVWSRDAMW